MTSPSLEENLLVEKQPETQNKITWIDYILELPWYIALYFAIKYYGWLYGIIGVILLWQAYTFAAKIFLGLEHLSGMDSFWFFDDNRNYANIVAYMRLERFKTKEIVDQMFERGMTFSRNRSKVVKFLGTWWFKELTVEEMTK